MFWHQGQTGELSFALSFLVALPAWRLLQLENAVESVKIKAYIHRGTHLPLLRSFPLRNTLRSPRVIAPRGGEPHGKRNSHEQMPRISRNSKQTLPQENEPHIYEPKGGCKAPNRKTRQFPWRDATPSPHTRETQADREESHIGQMATASTKALKARTEMQRSRLPVSYAGQR